MIKAVKGIYVIVKIEMFPSLTFPISTVMKREDELPRAPVKNPNRATTLSATL